MAITMARVWLIVGYCTVSIAAQCEQLVAMDFSALTNPGVVMDWTNALGTNFTDRKLESRATHRVWNRARRIACDSLVHGAGRVA
eukprot:2819484-Prymnesium_polylepis.1